MSLDERATIVAAKKGVAPKTIALEADSITVGRDPQCDLVLEDKDRYVSRLHCTIDRVSGAWWLHDNDSKAGAAVNGNPVDKRVKLSDGDVIQIVDWELRFHDPHATRMRPGKVRSREMPRRLEYRADSMRLSVDGSEVQEQLSPQEHRLLRRLFEKVGVVCTKRELRDLLWESGIADDSALAGLVRRLRQKIEPDPSHPVFLVTVPGFGYRLDDSPPQAL